MLYIQFIANCQPDKIDEYCELMEKFAAETKKHGATIVGAWRTDVGQREEVTTIECAKDMADWQTTRSKVFSDPVCLELIKKLRQVRTIRSKFLVPTSYSPLQ